MHEARGDKIIVFSDDIFTLKWLAKYLRRPYISGEVSQLERLNILEYFK
jgi:DNA excision repair protein ERCC-3